MQDGLAVGVVGCGNWGSKHVRVLSLLPEVRQLAAIEPNRDTLNSVLSAFPQARGFEDLESALPHVSALVIATPPPTHYRLALAALRHGKHVLVEKPMTESTHEAVQLLEEARQSNCVLMTGHVLLFNPGVKELRNRSSQGNLGTICSVHARQFSLGRSVHGADAVWDLAPHSISVFNDIVGSLPTSVIVRNAFSCKHKDTIHVELTYNEIGASGFIHIARGETRRVRTFTVIGTEKWAVYDDLAEDRRQMYREAPIQGLGSEPSHGFTGANIEHAEPLVEELRHFLGAIKNRSVPKSSGRDGMIAVAIMEAIDRSRRSQRPSEVCYPSGLL